MKQLTKKQKEIYAKGLKDGTLIGVGLTVGVILAKLLEEE